MALEITDASFEKEVLQESLPVLVDFWAKWCGPCRALAPTIEELSTQYNGKVKICKLFQDFHLLLAYRFLLFLYIVYLILL